MNIRQHKLAWRWTDSRYAVLPEHVLSELRPIDEVEAKTLYDLTLSYLDTDALSPEFNSTMVSTERLSAQEGSQWLARQRSPSKTEVVLSWDPTVALRTSWALFVEYWQEFCYPASDDLVVFPSAGDWVLLYHHEEEFHFGVRKVDA
jgi:hypothetical protein